MNNNFKKKNGLAIYVDNKLLVVERLFRDKCVFDLFNPVAPAGSSSTYLFCGHSNSNRWDANFVNTRSLNIDTERNYRAVGI